METTPTQLMSGFGLPVCALLMHLCDAALAAQGYAPKMLMFAPETFSGKSSDLSLLPCIVQSTC